MLNEGPIGRGRRLVRGAASSVGRFGSAYLWLVRTHFVPNRGLVFVVLVWSAVSAASQGGVIWFIAVAVRRIQDPKTLGIPALEPVLSDRTSAIVMAGALLTTIATIGAVSNYRAAVTARKLGRRFHEYCAGRTLARLSALRGVPADSGFDEVAVQRMVARNGMLLGRTAESMVRLVEPIFRLLVAIALLIAVDSRLAWFVIPLFAVMLPGVQIIGGRVKRNAEAFYDNAAPAMGRHVRMSVMGVTGRMLHPDTSLVRSSISEDPVYRRYLDEYDSIALSNERLHFVIGSAAATILGLSLVVAGHLAYSGQIEWPKVIVFLMALWQLQRASQSCGNGVALLHRFYPFVSQTRRFLSLETRSSRSSPVTEFHIAGEDGSIMRVGVGDRLMLLADLPLDRFTLPSLLMPLIGGDVEKLANVLGSVSFASERFRLIGPTVRQAFRDGTSLEPSQAFRVFGIDSSCRDIAELLDLPLDSESWGRLPPRLRSALALAPLLETRTSVVMCDARLVESLAIDVRERFLGAFSDRILIVHSLLGRTLRVDSDRVAVLREGLVRAVGGRDLLSSRLVDVLPSSTASDDLGDDVA